MEIKLNNKKSILWILNIGLPMLIALLPITDLFTSQMKTFLIITVFAILAIALDTLPQSGITFLLPAFYVLFGLADASLAWYPWTMPTVWMIIGALLLVNTLESSGVLMRISYKIILIVGGSYKGIVLGLGLLGTFLNIILFGNAYIILAGLAYGLCKALSLEKFSKEATGIFLAAAIGGLIPPGFCYGSNILMLEGIGASVIGEMHIGYLDFTFLNIPLMFYFIAALFLILIMFKSSKAINGKAYFQSKLDELGHVSTNEKKAIVWLIVLFAYIIYCGFKGLDCTFAFIVLPALMVMPSIGCGNENDIKRLDFSFILFIASCMSIGFVAQALGFGPLITSLATPLTTNATPSVVVFLIYVTNIVLNFLLTPMAIMTGLTPTFLQIAGEFGINPYIVYSLIGLGCDQILFPYEYALYMMYFSFGFIHMKDFIKYFGAKMLLCSIIVALIAIPFWHITGLFFA